MSRIQILSQKTVNQIAAGEVIERPASVVKELVENSLDAGADEIKVEITDGGKEKIIVRDNGIGMSPEEVELAFKKHATSKINKIEDLNNLSTLGFRGEALPSIASVAKVTAITRTEDQLEGTKLTIHGGDIKDEEETGCAVGTTIIVKDLFYNTPARKKYMKKTNTELAHVSDVITRNALANPKCSFSLEHNDNELLFVPKTDSQLKNIKAIYSKETAKKIISIDEENDYFRVKGFVCKPEITRSNRKHIYIFINSRYVENKLLKDAVTEGYDTLLPKHRYPLAFLDIKIDGEKIDVNVHPTKTKVRFEDKKKVKNNLSEIINEALLSEDLIPEQTKDFDEKSTSVPSTPISDKNEIKHFQQQSTLSLEEESEVKESKLSHMKVLGIVKDNYILAETPSGLAIIDQHAAHERINYENFKNKFDDEISSQKLVSPTNIELKPRYAAILRANEELIKGLGFDIENFGRTTFRIKGIPVIFGEVQEKEILTDILDELSDLKNTSLDKRKEEIIRYMACHSSVRSGDMISVTKAKDILEKLGKTENPYTCPHGRPTIVSFSEKEFEKWFKRT
ncbi:MAG: DNA mismatch repair endonuclease MutL [Thermoplasmatota archaeon]